MFARQRNYAQAVLFWLEGTALLSIVSYLTMTAVYRDTPVPQADFESAYRVLSMYYKAFGALSFAAGYIILYRKGIINRWASSNRKEYRRTPLILFLFVLVPSLISGLLVLAMPVNSIIAAHVLTWLVPNLAGFAFVAWLTTLPNFRPETTGSSALAQVARACSLLILTVAAGLIAAFNWPVAADTIRQAGDTCRTVVEGSIGPADEYCACLTDMRITFGDILLLQAGNPRTEYKLFVKGTAHCLVEHDVYRRTCLSRAGSQKHFCDCLGAEAAAEIQQIAGELALIANTETRIAYQKAQVEKTEAMEKHIYEKCYDRLKAER